MIKIKIKSISATSILDSRGEQTLEVTVTLSDKRSVRASVPQGKSTGSHEAHCVLVKDAIAHIQDVIAPKLKNMDPTDLKAIDDRMIALDGTPDKTVLGGNTLLGVSIACARAGALVDDVPLWKHIQSLAELRKDGVRGAGSPRLFVNVINGGLHAGNSLDIQEYLVAPKRQGFSDAIDVATRFYQALRTELVSMKGPSASNLGDEGGFAPNFKNDLEPLEVMKDVARKLHLLGAVDFGLDIAANSVSKNSAARFAMYEKMKRQFGVFYLEDPFNEENFDDFTKLTSQLGEDTLIAGDDLTTTNILRMKEARDRKSVNTVIIKPNQIGTLSEAIAAVRFARENDWTVVVSHRSGETNDDFIADFACGVHADGLKLGAPARGERIAKYNRLLEIEREQSLTKK